jgi:hypothetical protein
LLVHPILNTEMKKLTYIAFAIVALGLGACSKADIRTCADTETVEPVWKSNNNDAEITDPQLGGSDDEITDPNRDLDSQTTGN